MNSHNNIIRNEKGQGVLEYVIIASLVGIFCLVAVKQFGTVVQKRINNMKEQIVNNMPLK
jgi:hypothetical protein